MQPMSPKSPPPGPVDLYGKRKQMVKVQILEREINSLEDDLKSLAGIQPDSRCCKEVDTFVGSMPDPLIAINPECCKSCQFRKWICSCGFPLHLIMPDCCSGCLKTMSCQNCCWVSEIMCFPCNCCCFKCFPCKCRKPYLCVKNCCP